METDFFDNRHNYTHIKGVFLEPQQLRTNESALSSHINMEKNENDVCWEQMKKSQKVFWRQAIYS